MSIGPGSTLLHYRVVEKLGEGGMGEVWKAVDTSLDREVAIKILPEAFAGDPERLVRFEREARLLASLNHPNIAVVHGLHESDGRRFLAMELAAGEDLARRLAREPLTIRETVAVGRQVAEALEAAHEQGVVHRDLKPGNIQIDAEGRIKVLDFGLAKTVGTGTTSGSVSLSRTVTSAPTAAGVLLGTVAYMSPEQARGTPADKRSDIWGFGCVLYEALTGRPPFEGQTISDTLAAVLQSEPNLGELPAGTPAALRRLVERCLAKDKWRRLRDIGEARIVLDDLERGVAHEPPAVGSERHVGRWFALVAAGILLFAAGFFLRPPSTAGPAGIDPDVRVRRVTFDAGLSDEPALSPEGNYLAYTTDDRGQLDIVVVPLGGGNVNRVAGDPADDAQPAWSPDGSRLAFVSARDHAGRLSSIAGLASLFRFVHGSGGDIFLMPAMGGSAIKLVENACYPAWSPDGASIVFQSDREGSWDLWTVPVEGGEPRRLTNDPSSDYQPSWSPDGAWIAFGTTGGENGLRVVRAAGGEALSLTEPEHLVLDPSWSPDGRWIFFSSDRAGVRGEMNLWRIPFDGSRPEKGATPQRVTLGEGSDIGANPSRSDRIAYASVRFKADIWELPFPGGQPRPVVSTPSDEDYPHASHDDRRLLVESDRSDDELGLWIYDRAEGSWSKPTHGGARRPRWSPDSRGFAYQRVVGTRSSIVVQEVGAVTSKEVAVREGDKVVASPEWSPDGSRIAAHIGRPETSDLWVWELSGGDGVKLTSLPGASAFATWSPDGRTLAFQYQHEGPRQIWIVPATGGEPHPITNDRLEYSHPTWRPGDPARLAIVVDHKNIAIVHVPNGRVEPLTRFDESTVILDYPSWSADGRKIYFSLARKTGDVYLLEGY